MSGAPDPKPVRMPKRKRRTINRIAVKQAALTDPECWACGVAGANGHHLVPKDWTKPGPDEAWNIITLCGSGTSRCHGAYHGNPYVVEGERRDNRWVGDRIANRLLLDPRERGRLFELLAFLGTPTLTVQFFVGQLYTLPPVAAGREKGIA